MKELAKNLDIENYSKEISNITGISVVLIQKIIVYVIMTSNGPWYDYFEYIINNLLTAQKSDETLLFEAPQIAI